MRGRRGGGGARAAGRLVGGRRTTGSTRAAGAPIAGGDVRPATPSAALLGEALTIGLGGALVITLFELVALRSTQLPVMAAAAATVGGTGLFVAATIFVADRMAAWLALGAWGKAALRGGGGALMLIPVGLHLFDGGFASTLPGATSASVWLPLLGGALLTVVLRGAAAVPLDARPQRLAVAMGLGAGVALVELANRRLYPTQYRELHGALAILSCVGAGVALRLLWARAKDWSTRRGALELRLLIGMAAVVAVSALGVTFGNLGREARWTFATRGLHARLFLGAVHEALEVSTEAAALTPPPTRASRAPAPQLVAGDPHLNVVIVLVDSLRADLLRPGSERQRDFPNLSAFLDGAHSFPRAFAPSAGTDVSVATLITGRSNPFRPGGTTLAETMLAAGRTTHGVFPSEMLRWAGTDLVTRGFQHHDRLVADDSEPDVSHHGTGARTTDLGLAFLDRLAGSVSPSPPFFLWLHYFDVHEHHDLDTDDPALVAAALKLGLASDAVAAERVLRRDPHQKYRASVALVDRELGRLDAALRQRGLFDHTAVLLVSDHGESLGEDERLPSHHGQLLYEPLIRVPLAIRLPGSKAAVHDSPVTLVDLLPTLVQLTGAAPLADLDGRSLAPLLRDPQAAGLDEPRPIVLHEERQHGVVRWPHKLLLRPSEDLVELYDLSVDPEERVDLSERSSALTDELTQLYRSLPSLKVDRTRRGRLLREQLMREPAPL